MMAINDKWITAYNNQKKYFFEDKEIPISNPRNIEIIYRKQDSVATKIISTKSPLKKLIGTNENYEDATTWLRRHPTKKYKFRSLDAIKYIVVHCSDRDWTLKQLEEYDVDGYVAEEYNHISKEGLPGLTYHETVMKDGKHYHTLPHEEVSWHAGGYNTTSLAVCVMYRVKDTPPKPMIWSMIDVCTDLCLRYGLTPDAVVGHRELKGTGWIPGKFGSKRLRKTCPGLNIDMNKVRIEVARLMQVYLSNHKSDTSATLYRGLIDGKFGLKSISALKRFHDMKEYNTRYVQIYKGGCWNTPHNMREVFKGDIIKVFESDGTPVLNNGCAVMLVQQAWTEPEIGKAGCIVTEPLPDFKEDKKE